MFWCNSQTPDSLLHVGVVLVTGAAAAAAARRPPLTAAGTIGRPTQAVAARGDQVHIAELKLPAKPRVDPQDAARQETSWRRMHAG
jgi:hypothetical protein